MTSHSASLALLTLLCTATLHAGGPPPNVTFTGVGGALVGPTGVQSLPIDLDRDGTPDLRVDYDTEIWFDPYWMIRSARPDDENIAISGEWGPCCGGFSVNWAVTYEAGTVLGQLLGTEWIPGSLAILAFPPAESGLYLAIRVIEPDAGGRFGWLHVGVLPEGVIVHGWAIHNELNQEIVAGALPRLPFADLDGDGIAGATDLARLLGAWGGPGLGDLDLDGVVGSSDLAILLGAWGPVATPCGLAKHDCVVDGPIGCAGGACCGLVCGVDPHCCAISWDAHCVGLALDRCGPDGWPEECRVVAGERGDCNGNGILDSCEVAFGTRQDCDGDGLLDECAIASGADADCDGDGVPDSCVISSGADTDCNGNGIPDQCDLATALLLDCNGDGVPDLCQLLAGALHDCDQSGVPDICEPGMAPIPGGAITFDGATGHANVGTLGGFGGGLNSFTIEFWFRTTTNSSIIAPLRITDGPTGSPPSANHPVLSIEFNKMAFGCSTLAPVGMTGLHYFSLRDANGKLLARNVWGNLPDGVWHHVAWRVANAAANEMEIYIDGQLASLMPVGGCSQGPSAFQPWIQPLVLGAANNRGLIQNHFPGSLDEVRFWTIARDPLAIVATMNDAIDPESPGLFAVWRFDDGTGTAAQDPAGGHTAILIGGSTWIAPNDCTAR